MPPIADLRKCAMALYSPRHARPLPSEARAAAAATAADHPPTGTPAPVLAAEPAESVFSIVKRARITPFAAAPATDTAATARSAELPGGDPAPAGPKPRSKAANLRRAAKSATAARTRRARAAEAGVVTAATVGPVAAPETARTADAGSTASAAGPSVGATETTDVIESVSAAVVPHPVQRRRSIFDDMDRSEEDDDEPRRAIWLRPRALAGAAAAAMIVVALGATSLAEDGAPASGNTGAAGNPHGAVSLPANVVNDSQRIPVGATTTAVLQQGQRPSARGSVTAVRNGGPATSAATAAGGGGNSQPAGSSAAGHSTVQTSAAPASTPAAPSTTPTRTRSTAPSSTKPKPSPSVTCIINILGIRVCLPV